MSAPQTHTLVRYDEHLAVARLGAGSELPDWATSSTILSVTATPDETSVVCRYQDIPVRTKHEGPFTAYQVEGPLDFAHVGILSRLLTPVAAAEISVFVLSTYDTDWILVRSGRADAAEEAWRRSGHTVVAASDQTGRNQ